MKRFPPFKYVPVICLVISLLLQACVLDINQIPVISELAEFPALLKETSWNSANYSSDQNLPSQQMTEVRFQVQVPENTNLDHNIYLSILDEVTGLALNPEHYQMQISDSQERSFYVDLPLMVGSVIKYRYERQADSARVSEHLSNGTPVRYRLFLVNGHGIVEDVISRWTDTSYRSPSGRIRGEAFEVDSGLPIPNLLVTAGGAQTITNSSGFFVIEGLPPGIHNLVAYALDGSYRTFQQGARVAPDSTTPAPIKLSPASLVDVTFTIKVPDDTPPVIPIRLAGNLHQLGNTFADLSGGINSLSVKMPVLNPLPDGRYQITLSLPVGADIRYKYTLGDGFWNAEHTPNGEFRLRQFVVPENDIDLEDTVDTWHTSGPSNLIFDVTVPETTPMDDYVSIQFKPVFGWTEPIPMWNIGQNRWAFILYSPLNLPGNFNYRYCRNNQCGKADDQVTQGYDSVGRTLEINQTSITVADRVSSWVGISTTNSSGFGEITTSVNTRSEDFWAGIEMVDDYHPSWLNRLPQAFNNISEMGSNWLIIVPTWTYGHGSPGNNPPILAPIAGKDALWFDIVDSALMAYESNLNVAIFPTPHYQIEIDQWWQSAPLDYGWWLIWFDQYRQFILHHADLANHIDAQALILGGIGLSPALPEGKMPDGSFSQVPGDAENRWRELISEVRGKYQGEIVWTLAIDELDNMPSFLDAVDRIYLLGVDKPIEDILNEVTLESFAQEMTNFLDNTVEPIYTTTEKPVVLGVYYPSIPDMQAQYQIYNLVLEQINQRQWVSGFISRGFYPPALLQDPSPSIHGKSASFLLSRWFNQMLPETYP